MRVLWAALPMLGTFLARHIAVIYTVSIATADRSYSGSERAGSDSSGGLLTPASDSHLKASRWWALHEAPYSNPEFNLHQTRSHFTPQQWSSFSPKRCGFDPEIVRAALHGVQVALRECERQMLTERWNCSRFAANYNGDNIFGKLLWKGIPETAFALAMISAGVTASVASECRRSLRCCPCRLSPDAAAAASWNATSLDGGIIASPSPSGSISHAGCDHNTKFARSFSKRLLEKSERGRGVRYLAMLHNYNAGIRAVIQTMGIKCLCHGTSGSCSHRICWREVANFQAIGGYLKERYKNAVRVTQGSPVRIFIYQQEGGGGTQQGQNPQQPPQQQQQQRRRQQQRQRRLNLVRADSFNRSEDRGGSASRLPRKQDLVYYESVDSTFFCHRDKFWSVLGVQKRICNLGQGKCSHICCGSTYKIEYYKHVDNKCNCRFVWCCEVKCQTCVTDRQRRICD